ncbi:SIR2 family protein [Aeribacillus sp. FSL W8-0870]|uniref:SIR2 family NAD-dependent protein deacylase n=1 Tax=unclassified Aeribacillus TaxID=2640495 RepID=UPI0030D0E428
MPLCMDDIEDIQEVLNEKKHRVIHLHGHIDKPASMIVDEDDYNNFYSDDKITSKLYSILGNRKLLFIGFSFNDYYFKDLYSKIIKNIGGEHFIIVPNLHVFDAKEYLKINLIPIGINVNKDNNGKYLNYVKALKVIFEQLT